VTSLHDYHLLLIPDLQAIHSCLQLHEMGKNWGQGYCFQTLFSLWVVVFMQALLTGWLKMGTWVFAMECLTNQQSYFQNATASLPFIAWFFLCSVLLETLPSSLYTKDGYNCQTLIICININRKGCPLSVQTLELWVHRFSTMSDVLGLWYMKVEGKLHKKQWRVNFFVC
jgi:hypothetical protein